jgi:signal transduction histidine kinase
MTSPSTQQTSQGGTSQHRTSDDRHLAFSPALGIRELCHDLQQEVTVVEHLLVRLSQTDEVQDVERALLAQVHALQSTLREAWLPPAPRTLMLRPIVLGAVQVYRLVHRGTLVLDTSTDGPVVGVASDLRRVMVNLLDNALKAAPEGAIEVSLAVNGDDVVLQVDDDGSATSPAPGYGTGLTVVRTVTEEHGGTVLLGSSTLGGLSVLVRLPRSS